MFEHRHEPLLAHSLFLKRVLRNFSIGLVIIFGSLGVGVLGYRLTEGMPWLDALLNASMILFGEGPVEPVRTAGGKWFASFYAMFSGVAFVSIVGIMSAPIVHRLFHKFHLDESADEAGDKHEN